MAITLRHWIKKYPNSTVYKIPVFSVLRIFYFGGRIFKVADSDADFTGYEWIHKEKVTDLKVSGYVWTGPELTRQCYGANKFKYSFIFELYFVIQ